MKMYGEIIDGSISSEVIEELAESTRSTRPHVSAGRSDQHGTKTNQVTGFLSAYPAGLQINRTQIAERTGTGISTLTPIIQRLVDAGYVEETVVRTHTVGRPHKSLTTTPELLVAAENDPDLRRWAGITRVAEVLELSPEQAIDFAVALAARALALQGTAEE